MTWYAGNRGVDANGKATYTPVEFGAINLTPADAIVQHTTGLVGALIIEPQGARISYDAGTRASVTVTKTDRSSYREFVVLAQDDANGGSVNAINYRTEKVPVDPGAGDTPDISSAFSDTSVPQSSDFTPFPQTPVFAAEKNSAVRFRVLYPNGVKGQGTVNAFEVHGHQWQERPHVHNSTEIGHNPVSQVLGTQQIVPDEKLDVVLPSAGGLSGIPGDYKYGAFQNDFKGLWGILRVTETGKDAVVIQSAGPAPNGTRVSGVNTVVPSTGQYAERIQLFVNGAASGPPIRVLNGVWTATLPGPVPAGASITAKSVLAPGKFGGEYTVRLPYPPPANKSSAAPSASPRLVPRKKTVILQ
jgi:hypothetical protein